MIKQINSIQNNTIKLVLSLQQKKHIEKHGVCFVEGEKIVYELINSKKPIKTVFVTTSKVDEVSKVIKNNSLNIEVVQINDKVAQKISNAVTNAGVFALLKISKTPTFNIKENFIVLDNLQDPTNLGAVIRTALAYNYKQIVLLNSVYAYLPKVIRASMGYVLNINVFNYSFNELESLVKDNNLPLICAHMKGENINTFVNEHKVYGIVAGNEGQGVSEQVLKLCTNYVNIPMKNSVESLNVAVSLAILMHELSK